MTALWFDALTAADRVSVKPHASPVLHAVNYLIGRLARPPAARCAGTAGCSPTRPGPRTRTRPDYSTGSVGIGATAPVWGALARRYAVRQPRRGRARRPADQPARRRRARRGRGMGVRRRPVVQRLGEVLWVVDLNRQSLDRIVPDIAIGRWQGMFAAAGWQVLEVKYGGRLTELFAARTAGRCGPASTGWATRSTSGCCARRWTGSAERLVDGDDALAGCWPTAPTPTSQRCCATSAGTTWRRCGRRSGRSTRTGRRCCSRTPSRAGGCPSRAIRATTRRCSPRSSGASSRRGSAPTRTTRGGCPARQPARPALRADRGATGAPRAGPG